MQCNCPTNLGIDGRQRFDLADLGPAVLGSSFCILKCLFIEIASDCDVKGALECTCFGVEMEDSYLNQYAINAFCMDLRQI